VLVPVSEEISLKGSCTWKKHHTDNSA